MIPWLSEDEKQWITEALYDAFDNTGIGTAVTYCSGTGHTFDAATGVHTLTETSITLNILMCSLEQVEDGPHETGMMAVLIHNEDLGGLEPKVSDRITEGTATYEVESVDRAVLGKLWLLRVRKH